MVNGGLVACKDGIDMSVPGTTMPTSLGKRKYIINIIVALVAIALVVFYSICGNYCSYLKGSLFGIDLTYAGIGCMILLIILNLLRWDALIFLLLAAGVGTEAFLVGFQVWHQTYCPYCLVFGALLVGLFIYNFQRRLMVPAAILIVAGFLLFLLFFKGSVAITFGVG
jgi:hypothetical protein